MNIQFDTPISEKMHYQFTTYYISMLAEYNSRRLKSVELLGSYSNILIKNGGAVATGCSGGVDSFYAIIKHAVNNLGRGHRLTYLLFASCGTLDNRTERIEAYYNSTFPKIKGIANSVGCELIGCYTNLHEFYRFPYEGFCNFYNRKSVGQKDLL